MSIIYKTDVIEALRKAGLTTYQIRKAKLFSENSLQHFREGKLVSFDTFDKVCELTGLQLGDILEYKKDEG